MVDIAAQLSLTPSGPAIDPAAILGAETADTQAFGNILAGRVQANTDTGAPVVPLPPFPAPAGNRQPGGKALPGAAQILPDAAPLGLEAPAAQVLPSPVLSAISPLKLVTTAPPTKFVPQAVLATDETETAEPKQDEASPVHGLIKMLTAALKGHRTPAEQPAADAPADPETASAETAPPKQAAPVVAPAPTMLQFALPILANPTVPTQTVAPDASRAPSGGAAPILLPAAPQQTDAALREQIRPVLAQFLAQPVQVQPVQMQPVQMQPAGSAPAEVPAVPILTVAAALGNTPPPAITLVSAPMQPVGPTVAARIKVAAPLAKDGSIAAQPALAGRDVSSEAPVVASGAAPAVRAVLAERATADLAAAPAIADSPQLGAAAQAVSPATPAPTTAIPTTGALTVEMPRHDFAALVDRLVEARNTSVSQSTHASLTHAEFGQVSLHFQQDGGDLKVGMSSADPDFARAAQAAQAMMPADRQNPNADTNSRGQSQSSSQNQTQGQSQTATGSSQAHHEAAGRGEERSDQQNRNGQGRNSRGGNNPSNPSPRWAERDQSQTRGGIFA